MFSVESMRAIAATEELPTQPSLQEVRAEPLTRPGPAELWRRALTELSSAAQRMGLARTSAAEKQE